MCQRQSQPAWKCLQALVFGLLLAPAGAAAGDLTVFAAEATPFDGWSRGYGATLSYTFFEVLGFEGEAARLPGEVEDSNMTSFTVSALLAPRIGSLVPYGGVGFGLFRQTLGEDSDTGRLHALVLGVKLNLDVLVLKAEYRRLDLSGEPLIDMDQRFSLGAGISF